MSLENKGILHLSHTDLQKTAIAKKNEEKETWRES